MSLQECRLYYVNTIFYEPAHQDVLLVGLTHLELDEGEETVKVEFDWRASITLDMAMRRDFNRALTARARIRVRELSYEEESMEKLIWRWEKNPEIKHLCEVEARLKRQQRLLRMGWTFSKDEIIHEGITEEELYEQRGRAGMWTMQPARQAEDVLAKCPSSQSTASSKEKNVTDNGIMDHG